MGLISGLIFGTGLGFITASAGGMAPDYTTLLFLAGTGLIAADLGLRLYRKRKT